MIYILLSLLLLVIILLTIGLIRYHLALVNLSQQIEDKNSYWKYEENRSVNFLKGFFTSLPANQSSLSRS